MSHKLNTKHADILKNLGITEFNEMQLAVMEKAATQANMLLLSPTGTGKTLAYLMAILNRLSPGAEGVQSIIIAPSRELALQIEQVFRNMKTSFKVTCCYGGHSMQIEQNSLSEAPALVIATPGRLVDHIERRSFDTRHVKVVVLDEYDKSLQMGFEDQIEISVKEFKGKQQYILTSATQLAPVPKFIPFTNPELVSFLFQEVESKLKLKLIKTATTDKVETLMNLVAGFKEDVCLVFCNHRDAVERISAVFKNNNFEHGILHGAMEQIDREKSLIKFRGGAFTVLISTDLASRGLDIPEIRHVVHYQLPTNEEAFTHRNGRTARMHAEGEAYLVQAADETLPDYLDEDITELKLPKAAPKPVLPKYICLYIGAGKKDKISKGDIAGLLMKKGGLQSDDIGLITTLDNASYASVRRSLVNKVLPAIKNEKVKKLKVKIEIAS